MDNNYDIFISYRRVDSKGFISGQNIARSIKLELKNRGYDVFFDYDDITDEEFEKTIIPAIQKSKVFLLVLSKDALLRCVNQGDWVRREIETALNSGCKIIPINPDGAFEGWPENLPESIHPIRQQEISDVRMGSLFEKSIDKIEEERFENILNSKLIAHRLRSLTFLFLYFIFGAICCYNCAESLYLTFDFPFFLSWVIILGFFILLSISIKEITNTFNYKRKIKNRTAQYLMCLYCLIVFGVLFIVPTQTHALYYNHSIKEELFADLKTTKKYLTNIQDREHGSVILDEIEKIDNLEKQLIKGTLNTKDRKDVLKAESVISKGYNIIRNYPDIEYDNMDDELRYSTDIYKTRTKMIMQVSEVWRLQFKKGLSVGFLVALIISISLCVLSTSFFVIGMDVKSFNR